VESSADTGYLRCVMSDSYLAVSKGDTIVVYTYTSAGFSQRYVITESSTCVDLSIYENNLVVLDSTGVKFYKLFDDLYDYVSANSVAIASATGVAINNSYVAVGLPASQSGDGNTLVYPITYGSGSIENSIESTSGSMSINTPSLYITSDTEVTASDNASVVMSGGLAVNKSVLVSGSITTTGLTATGSITGSNITTGGLTATGSITGANITTGGLVATGTYYCAGGSRLDILGYDAVAQTIGASSVLSVKWGSTSSTLSMAGGVLGVAPSNLGLTYNSTTGLFTNSSGSTKAYLVQGKISYSSLPTSGTRETYIQYGGGGFGTTRIGHSTMTISGTTNVNSFNAYIPLADTGTFDIRTSHDSSGGAGTISALSHVQVMLL